MKILFITATRLGDGVLSTGALDHFIRLYPDAEITVACGPVVAGLFRDAPRVNRVIPMEKEPLAAHWVKLWRTAIRTNWDIIVDLRNSLMTRLVFSRKKYIWSGKAPRKHKVEQIAAVIKVFPPPEPRLWFSEDTIRKAAALVPEAGRRPVLAIGPAANWLPKTWPAENFIALAERLTAADSILPHARVAVFAAPGEERTAYKVLNSVPPERRIDVIAKAEPVVAAAAIQRCRLYVGNDSGLMHCAAAAGVPTLGLFGPSWPELYRPWGEHCAYVSTPENFEQLTSYSGYDAATAPGLMASLTVDMAYDAAVKLWQKQAR
ncbi:MAG: glycosyltransferase family 9 protein [Alphaproteobacteria bacterium]|nr:glycosyltransferase family 9 protein [Alphaproteobacteria bacterium]